MNFRRLSLALLFCWLAALPARAAAPPRVYVLLWFDTEDYILPASDDAARHVAEFLTHENLRATFKVVGEKARTLERRGRRDVIDALREHEIGYHSNFHSVHPTPAVYLADLGWDEGVAEFDRREGPGRRDVERIFGTPPTCYGQPGSSWGPQSYGAMRRWGMRIYLDAGRHVNLGGRPCYYDGILNLYHLTHTMRADLKEPAKLKEAEDRFLEARRRLLAEGGGLVSIVYHPCEFVHRQFWDGVNFAAGANPPRDRWKLPPTKTPEETRAAFAVFEDYVRFLHRFPDVSVITASQALRLYPDRAYDHRFTPAEIGALARAVGPNVTFQKTSALALSAAEVFELLSTFVAGSAREGEAPELRLKESPFGPAEPARTLSEPVTVDYEQFLRTAADVADYVSRRHQIPSTVWLGSVGVPPEAYLVALARVAAERADGRRPGERVRIEPARLVAADYVADDGPELWRWVIFPPGFRAPKLMQLAKRQAWTLKPARLASAEK